MSTVQVWPSLGICVHVEAANADQGRDAAGAVRCLACGTAYDVGQDSPPTTVGCPACGDVTWIAAEFAPRLKDGRRRSADDPQRSQSG